VSIYKPS